MGWGEEEHLRRGNHIPESREGSLGILGFPLLEAPSPTCGAPVGTASPRGAASMGGGSGAVVILVENDAVWLPPAGAAA